MKNIKKGVLCILLLFLCVNLCAQSKVENMRAQARAMQKQIADKEKILLSSQNDLKSKMQNLELIKAQIKERQSLVSMLNSELSAINDSIAVISREVKRHEALVDTARSEYARSLRIARNYGSLKNKMLFIVSASDFNTMVRRYRYVRQYMNAHRVKADELKMRIAALEAEKALADSIKADKENTLTLQNAQQKELQALDTEQRRLISDLQKESKKVDKELKKQKQQLQSLNKDIDRLIEEELARRKKEAEKAAAAAKKSASASKTPKVASANSGEVAKMSGSFQQNKGKLPAPLTGPYHLVSGFGLQNGVTGKGQVMIDNGGIVLQGQSGAQARCIFEGEVIVVYSKEDYALVIVEHGKYMSVYCQLDKIHVKKGDKVIFGKYGGTEVTYDGEDVLILRADDIYAICE